MEVQIFISKTYTTSTYALHICSFYRSPSKTSSPVIHALTYSDAYTSRASNRFSADLLHLQCYVTEKPKHVFILVEQERETA